MKAIFGDIVFTQNKSSQRWLSNSGNTNGIIDVYTPYRFDYEVLRTQFEIELEGEEVEKQAEEIAYENNLDYVIPDLFISSTIIHSYMDSHRTGDSLYEFY